MPSWLRNYRNETQDPDVQALLDDLLPRLSNVTSFERTQPLAGQGVGGGNTQNLGGGQYVIRYSAPPAPELTTDLLAVIVHELTHVAVNESYDSDMLNLPVPQLEGRAAWADPGPNEDAIQLSRLRQVSPELKNNFINMVHGRAQDLLSALGDSGLSSQRQAQISQKLTVHTMVNPFKEYDAVLSHLLVWSDQDGVDAPEIKSSDFYQNLTSKVGEATGWRRAGNIPIPTTAEPTDSTADTGTQTDPGTDSQDDAEIQADPTADPTADSLAGTRNRARPLTDPTTDPTTDPVTDADATADAEGDADGTASGAADADDVADFGGTPDAEPDADPTAAPLADPGIEPDPDPGTEPGSATRVGAGVGAGNFGTSELSEPFDDQQGAAE